MARWTRPNDPVPNVLIKVKFFKFSSADDLLLGFRSIETKFSGCSDKSTCVDTSAISSLLLLDTDPNGVCGGDCGNDSHVNCSIKS